MLLLVSVASAADASAAVAGGADLIDAKDSLAGALGAVSAEVLRRIHAAVAGERPVTAALGDAADEAAIECAARACTAAGAALVKLGFAGITSAARVAALTAAAVRGAGARGVVAVAYADAHRAGSIAPAALLELAARVGAKGVLLDTADKHGPGLRDLVAERALAKWVTEAHEAGLFVALAGKLTAGDLTFVRELGAEIAGVRGAACDGGRSGYVTAERVRLLRALCESSADGSRESRAVGLRVLDRSAER
jgi:(5-formylfuran-3-yl)methyl phosphate synthase